VFNKTIVVYVLPILKIQTFYQFTNQ